MLGDAPSPKRRQGDAVLNELTTKVALISQAQALSEEANKARAHATDNAIATLGLKLDTIATGLNEPSGSPAGRQLLEKIGDVKVDGEATRKIVDTHEEIIQQSLGAVRMAKVAFALAGASFLAQIGGVAVDLLSRKP